MELLLFFVHPISKITHHCSSHRHPGHTIAVLPPYDVVQYPTSASWVVLCQFAAICACSGKKYVPPNFYFPFLIFYFIFSTDPPSPLSFYPPGVPPPHSVCLLPYDPCNAAKKGPIAPQRSPAHNNFPTPFSFIFHPTTTPAHMKMVSTFIYNSPMGITGAHCHGGGTSNTWLQHDEITKKNKGHNMCVAPLHHCG